MHHTKTLPKKAVKRTYTLPAQTMAQFEAVVPAGQRGAALSEAIAHWLEEKRLADLRARIEESFEDEENMKLYLDIDRECSPAADEVWALLPPEDDWPEPAIFFPQGYAAYEAEHGQ